MSISYKMSGVEMRIPRWMYGKSKKYEIENKHFRNYLGITWIGDKIRETCKR